MPDLKLDPASWDLDLTSGGLALTDDASGQTAAQGVAVRLKLFQGEWFLDTRIGVDYWGTILKKNPNLADIEAAIRSAILATPGVSHIVNYVQVLDRASRTLAIAAEIKASDGTTITINGQVP